MCVRVGEKMITGKKKKSPTRGGLGMVPHTFKSKVGGRNRLISMNWRLAWST